MRKNKTLHHKKPDEEMPRKEWGKPTTNSNTKHFAKNEEKLVRSLEKGDTREMLKIRAKILEEGTIKAPSIVKEQVKAPRGRGSPSITWVLQSAKLPKVDIINATYHKKEAERQKEIDSLSLIAKWHASSIHADAIFVQLDTQAPACARKEAATPHAHQNANEPNVHSVCGQSQHESAWRV